MTRKNPETKEPSEKDSGKSDENPPEEELSENATEDEEHEGIEAPGDADKTAPPAPGTSGIQLEKQPPTPDIVTRSPGKTPGNKIMVDNQSVTGQEEKRKSSRRKSAKGTVINNEVYSSVDTADEVEYDERKKSARRKSNAPKNPTLHIQMSTLMEKSDRQAARIDELFKLMRQPPPRSSPGRHGSTRGDGVSSPPRDKQAKRHVSGSYYKRRSPKNGYPVPRRTSRAPSRYDDGDSPPSSTSSNSDTESQVRRAIDMLEPRFSKYKGKRSHRDDRLCSYRPFAYLEREQQRAIIKSGHPEELTVAQHLSGLCGMALEKCDAKGDTYAIVAHIAQILEDQSYMQWENVRAFSNTVIAQIARGRWEWADDRLIERCRTNMYMRCRQNEEPTWAVPCPKFNKGRCNSQESHNVGEVTMRHICAGCAVNGYENNHTLRACKWRKGGNINQKKESADDRRENRAYRSSGRHQEGAHETSKN